MASFRTDYGPSQRLWETEGSALRKGVRSRAFVLWVAATVFSIGGFAGWSVSRLRQPVAAGPVYRLHIDPPEAGQFVFGLDVGGIALSPDGRSAAFVATGEGKTGLWIRRLDGARARLIPGTDGASYPFWSPDSKVLGFFTVTHLKRVDPSGDSPSIICSTSSAGRGGAWTSDGQILFGTVSSGLFRVPASGGTPEALTRLDKSRGEEWHRFPQALPAGRFLYFIQGGKPEITGVYVASMAQPADRVRVLATEANAIYAPGPDGRNYLLWSRDGALVGREFDLASRSLIGETRQLADSVASIRRLGAMDAAVSASGVLLYSAANSLSQFMWLDRTGKAVGVFGEPGEYGTFRLSPDGRRVAASRDRPGGSDLWLLQVDHPGARQLALKSNISICPAWSPDSRMIAFSSGFPRNMFVADLSGTGAAQRLSQSPRNQFVSDWSRDGRWILYHEISPDTSYDPGIIPMTAGSATGDPKLLFQTPSNEAWARFSPGVSPEWVAYHSDVTGRFEIYVQAFPEAHGRFQISLAGGRYPQWGPGGRELFYVSPENNLMAVDLKLGKGSVEPSHPHELFPLPVADLGFSPYDTSPDGQRFLMRAMLGGAAQPLTVVVNWPSLLK